MPTPSEQRRQELLDRWMENRASQAEEAELLALLEAEEGSLHTVMQQAWEGLRADEVYTAEEKDAIADRALQRPKRSGFRWWTAAAVIFVLAGAALTARLLQRPTATPPQRTAGHDVAPGKQGAVLTLANGETIVLDSLRNGPVASQQGTRISLQNGSLAYDDSRAAEVSFNTVATPRGRKFQLLLPDGSKVWLNAASSLRFPTAFNGKDRTVEITGEAYFEVARNPQQPFIVKVSNDAAVEVLGTHFNINAYRDESSINTTLLEGAVKVLAFSQSHTLQPGQQARIFNDERAVKVVSGVDLGQAIAWKNGFFNFQGASLEAVMRQLARWYDLEVIYEGKAPQLEFGGELPNTLNLSQVVKILGKVEVKFRIEENRRLIVTP